jgi:hypothetical protein
MAQAPKKVIHYVTDPHRFGADSPSWTIGSSRHPPRPPPDYPGPNHYDVPLLPFHTQLSHTIQEREFPDYRTVTTDIDFVEIRKFPDIRSRTIGVDDGTSFVQPSDAPGPSYFPDDYVPKHNYRRHAIASRHDLRPDVIPSPGDYDPTDPGRPSSPVISMKTGAIKRFHDLRRDQVPGPGEYQIGPVLKRAPNWSQKLRVMPGTHCIVKKIELEPWETPKVQI